MCRSTADGGRRCTSSSKARTRALGTARKAVERARHTVNHARATGDPDAVTAAEAKLTAAQQHLDTTRAAHPLTPDAGHPGGHDTAEDTAMPEDTTTAGTDDHDGPRVTSHTTADGSTFINYAAPGSHVGEQHGAVYGDFTAPTDQHTADAMPPGLADTIRQAHEAAARAHEQAHHQARNRSTTNTTSGNDDVRTQIGAIYGGTFHNHADQ